jgi:hypothetical protein
MVDVMIRFIKRSDSIPSMDLGNYVVKQNFTILTKEGSIDKFLGL